MRLIKQSSLSLHFSLLHHCGNKCNISKNSFLQYGITKLSIFGTCFRINPSYLCWYFFSFLFHYGFLLFFSNLYCFVLGSSLIDDSFVLEPSINIYHCTFMSVPLRQCFLTNGHTIVTAILRSVRPQNCIPIHRHTTRHVPPSSWRAWWTLLVLPFQPLFATIQTSVFSWFSPHSI